MTVAYVVVEYPTTPIPAGGYVQSPPGVLVPFAASQNSRPGESS